MLLCSINFRTLDEVVLVSLPPHNSVIDHAIIWIVG